MAVSLPFPYENIPSDHQDVDHHVLYDTVSPLLRGTKTILGALDSVQLLKSVDPDDLAQAIALLASQVDIASSMLERWYHTTVNP